MKPPVHAPTLARRQNRDNEKPLVEDIRLLGRLLGDVIRLQEGPEAFELVEQIRKLSVAFRRDADHIAQEATQQPDVFNQGFFVVSVLA
ncbi:MAG: phosphoenolpyruvate carboxylase, partial [Limnohabitans sp.]